MWRDLGEWCVAADCDSMKLAFANGKLCCDDYIYVNRPLVSPRTKGETVWVMAATCSDEVQAA